MPSDLTRTFEGWRGSPYVDSRGNKSIGWGFKIDEPHVRKLLPDDVVSGKRELNKEEAKPIFNELYSVAEKDAKDYAGEDVFNNLSSSKQDVLVDMSYNLGRNKLFEFEDMQKALKDGDDEGVAREMIDSEWYGQVKDRAKHHVETFRGYAADDDKEDLSVKNLQTNLKELGFDPGEIDGINGPKTKKAVKDFQGSSGIETDGIFGPNTKQKINEALDVLNIFKVRGAEGSMIPFDPEGKGYDDESAKQYGIEADDTGHFPSRVPQTGLILKGRNHPTFDKTIQGEKEAGHEITKGEDGRYYSQPKQPENMFDMPGAIDESLNSSEILWDSFDDDIHKKVGENLLKSADQVIARGGADPKLTKAVEIASNVGEKILTVDKGLMSFISSTPSALGGLIKNFGEKIEESPGFWEFALNPIGKGAEYALSRPELEPAKIDERLTDAGNSLIEANRQFLVEKGLTGQEFEGVDRVLFDLGSGAGSLAAALGVSVTTGSPIAAGTLFGILQKGNLYTEARDRGLSVDEADIRSNIGGMLEGSLEAIGLNFMLKRFGGRLATTMIRSGEEFIQEGTQQLAEDLVANWRGQTGMQIAKNVGYSAFLGMLLGGGASVSLDIAERNGVIGELQEAGFDPKQAKRILSELIVSQRKGMQPIVDAAVRQANEVLTSEKGEVGKEFKGSADQFVGALKTAGQAITKLPSNIGAAVLKAHQGAEGASVVDKGWIQKTLQDADTNADEFVRDIYKKYEDKQAIKGIPIKITDIAELPRNIAFSVTSMAAGLAAGTPIAFAPIPGARVAAWSLGTVASGKAAYEMSTYEIMQEYLEAKNDESIETKGKGITIEEENELKKIFGYEAAKYGLWEAVPEALSNLAFAKILTAPLAKIAGKNIATRIVAKMTGLYGEELLTETITQKGQAGIEKEAGLREEDINWGQALKEVAPQTFLLTTVMGGAGASAIAIKNKVMPSLAKEIKTKKITPEQEEIIRQELEDHIDKVLKEGKPIDIIPIGIQDPKEKQKQLKEVGVRDDLINIIIEEDVAVEFHENEDWDENFFPAVLAEGMFIKGAKINGKVRKPAFHIRKNIQRGNINDVVAHEMGHHLDEKLGLGKKVYNKGDSFINKVFGAGFQNLAKDDLSGEALEKWRKAFRDGDPHFAGEAIAEIVRRWKLEPNFAKENPEIAEFLEQELGTKKQLKQIKQIAQPPEKPIEPQKEKAVAEPEIIEKVKPIAEEGEGEEKVHGLSKSVERQAIKEGFVEEFSDLPTYKTRNVEDAAERATDFIEKNYDLAKKIALGEAPEQGNVRSQELFKAISIQAYASGDIDTITELAFSKKAASIATELGQRVQAYDTGNRYDPIQTIRKVIKEREEFSKGHPKSEKEISNLKQKLDETESKIKELEKKLEESKVTRKEKKKAFGSDNKVFTQQKLEEARKNLRAKMSGLHAGVDPTAVVELTEIGGFYFEGGIREFSAWSKMLIAEFGDNIKPYLSDVWKNVRAEYKKHNIENAKEKIGKMAEEGMSLPKPFVVQSIAEELVESGVVNRANLVEAVREILQDSYPDITYRETADLISGYGQYSRLSKDAVKKILRDIKGQLQQLSKLEDLQEGISPLKTGTERRAVSDEERRLIKLVEEAKRKYRVKTTDPETQLRSALDSYKAGLRNQIKDLEKQILERKKIIKDKTPLSLDEEAVRLMIKKNELRLIFSAIFSKKGLTTEQRIKIAEKSLARSIETYERKLKEGDISPITKKRTPISTPKIEQLRTKRETLKKQLDDIRNLAKPKKTQQEISLQTLKTRLNNEITRLEDRIERLDFEVEQKREVILDAEAQKLKDKRESIKHGYDAARHIEATLTKEEISKIVSLSSDVSDAQKKVEVKGDWTADNAKDVEDFFYKKNEFEEYVDSLKPKSTSDNINRFFDYIRASILASPRILQNSFLYQIVPGIERTITKRIVTGVFNDADLKSTIVEKYLAKLSGVTPSKKSLDFIKRQVAMAIRIYHKTGIDISRQDKMESTPKFYGETFSKITGKSVFAKIGRTVNLAPKWLAGGTDMFFANIGRADTAIMMSKERAKIEALNEKLPEGMTEEQRADQLLKESYSFNPKDKRAEEIRERGIEDAHRMNNTQSGWWSDTIIELRKLLRIGNIRFGKAIIPFAKIANVVIAEGTKTATGLGIARSIYDINVAARKSNAKDRSKLMNSAVNNLIRYVGLMGAAILLTSFFDDDDYIGTYSSLSNKQYQLSVARGARTGSVRIAGRWISLRYLPMINIPISAIMEARQAKGTGDSIVAGYARGIAGQILEAPGIKELGQGFVKLKRSVKPSDTEKLLNSLGLDGERILNWAKVRAIPSVLSYDVWNALFPKKGKYDFMGREVKRGGAFRDDKSNNITVEFSRLSKEGYFPTISNPTGAYAVKLEEHLGEEEYAEVLAELQQNYADKVSTIINSTGYKLTSDEKKKKRIDRIRDKEILHELRRKERKLPK